MEVNKINLVVFIREYPVGMAGTKRVQNFLDFLSLKGILINVISFRSHLPQPAVRGIYNTIPYINVGAGIDLKLSQLHKIIGYYFNGLRVITQCRKKGHHNIIYNYGGINVENLLFVLWAKLLGFKLIITIEEDYSFFGDDVKLISKFKNWSIKRFDFLNCRLSDAIIAISIHLRDKYLNLKVLNVSMIPVTAKMNFDQQKAHFNSPLQVVYAGSFADKDGVEILIEGFLSFNRAYRNAILILTGKSARQNYYAEKYKDEKDIHFRGFIEEREFYDLLRQADILCMCRSGSGFANAGFPFKLGEYLATGNPVICSRVSDVEYYLEDKDAYLIEPGKPEQVSEALKQITDNPEKARETGMNGLNKCIKYFSPETNGQLLLEVLISVANE